MTDSIDYGDLAAVEYANVLKRSQVMDCGIRELWSGTPRIAGSAFTVQLAPGDHLMLHAAIYEAPPGSIIVADGCDTACAVAGGNVCAIAQQRGIKGFVVDGVIRDLAEIRKMAFPVYVRGVVPFPGKKAFVSPLNETISCGGATVNGGDIVIADEEGIVVLPAGEAPALYAAAHEKFAAEQALSLDEWEAKHRAKLASVLPNFN